MRTDRPSIGEFSGAFNISDEDYATMHFKNTKRLTIDSHLPTLSDAELAQLREQVRCQLIAWKEAESDRLIKMLGTQDYFAFDEDGQVDRTFNIWLSSARALRMVDVLQLQELLSRSFRFWRIVIRLPAGVAPDITIYRDHYIVGDKHRTTEEVFLGDMKKSIEAQLYSTQRYEQLQVLLKKNTWRSVDEHRRIGRSPFLKSTLDKFSNYDATIWLAIANSHKETNRYTIHDLEVCGNRYEKHAAFTLYGNFDAKLTWRAQPKRESSWLIVPYPLKSDCEGKLFILRGFDRQRKEQWQIEGRDL